MISFSQNPADAFFLSVSEGFEDYRLLDSGAGRKLEKFGKIITDRPEAQALWTPKLDKSAWQKADGVFSGEEDADQGRWRMEDRALHEWPLHVMGVTMLCRFSAFRHLGIFPEQAPQWQWMVEKLQNREAPKLLNLFAYTGAASLIAARTGAEVTHVDASKKAIEWAKDNQKASELEDAKIRWIIEDARKFAAREVRRGKAYDGILIDPPKFGRGTDGEVWDFFTDTPALLDTCKQLVKPDGFIILTSYAIRASFLSIDNLMRDIFKENVQSGELAVKEQSAGRILAAANFSRWCGK